MARNTVSKWGKELGQRIQDAWRVWRERHPDVKHVIYTNASKDAGMWTACVRIFRHDGQNAPMGRSNHLGCQAPEQTKDWDAPDWHAYRSDWAPTKEDCKRRAVEDFERECVELCKHEPS